MEWLTILILCVTLSLSLLFTLNRGYGRRKLPPGPPALLFLAKLLLPGRSDIGTMLRVLHARHGPIISIWLLRSFVFIADHRLAHSLLIKGGGNFDDRPPPSTFTQLFFPCSIGVSPYGAYWRLVRRNLSMQMLHPSRIRLFAPARQLACDAMLASLRVDADADAQRVVTVRPLLARCLFKLIAEMCLGARLCPEVLEEMQQLNRQIFVAMASFPLFSVFPALTMRKRWARYVALRERQHEVLLTLIRAPHRGGTEDPPCYADSLLAVSVSEEGDRPLTDAEMVSLWSEFMIASMDATVTMMEWIMAELVNHPEAQSKVYEEVRGNGVEPEPELSDGEGRMTYLRAVVLETLRLHPGAHLILPHSVQSDAEISGYMLPKGAVINFFVADLGLDDTVWTTAAREFQPERFLDGGGDMDLDITGSREIKMAPFGAGRRMCPGYMLATDHAECLVGTLVRDFQWLPPPFSQGQDMTEELGLFITMKHRLRARIIPRTY